MPFENMIPILIVVAGLLVVMAVMMVIVRRYKRCPSNRILVIYGKVKSGQSAKCLHGGGTFVWPLIQNYSFLSLDPMQIEIPLEGALSKENIRVKIPSVFTVAIGTDDVTMNNAAIRLLGLSTPEIMKQAEDIIFGQLRQVIASMPIEDINRNRDLFLTQVQQSLEPELQKIGQVLINVNIKDITDESGYIEAIGRKAASEAVQQALIDVAEQEKRGAIGVALAERERAVEVANAEKIRDIGTTEAGRDKDVTIADLTKQKSVGEQRASFEQEAQVREAERAMRISVADANAKAVAGENTAKAEVAEANAKLRVKEAEAFQIGETRHREAQAAVREAQYRAEAKAAAAEGIKIEAEKRAELEALAKAVKAQVIVNAEAEAERKKIDAEGEAAAIFAKLDAEARGQYEILAKKGDGLKRIVESCGGADEAFKMLMLEHIEGISKTAADAIANIKFDKVGVGDGGGRDADGRPGGAAGFVRNMAGALPPALELMRNIGGVDMPEYFGHLREEELKPKAPAAKPGAEAEGAARPGGGGEAPKSGKDKAARPERGADD